jgi:hypothetical protein
MFKRGQGMSMGTHLAFHGVADTLARAVSI